MHDAVSLTIGKICANPWCQQSFVITDDDLAFYDKVSPVFAGKKELIPPPTLCPECRMQRKLTWRNERTIYSSECSACHRSIISTYAPDSGRTVLCPRCFWDDAWDAQKHGRPFDFSRSCSEQFADLQREVPLMSLINVQSENSDYCHRIYEGRNNYLSFIALYEPENLLYTYYTITCKDSADITFNQYCELCYETVDAEHLYNSRYCRRARNCRDSYGLEDCIGCADCIGCKNLHQKQYCIFNEQKSAEEYREFLDSCAWGSYTFVRDFLKKCDTFFLQFPHRSLLQIDTENVRGSNVHHCRLSDDLFDFYESEHMRHCSLGERSHDCVDCYGMGYAEFCYDSITLLHNQMTHFSVTTIGGFNLLHCMDQFADTHDCFGCIGLKKKRYCILNKQYTKEEYEALVPKIIEKMKADGEWGEFFPVTMSPFAYNETVAQEYFPMKKEEVLARGWKWRDQTDEMPKVERIIPAAQLPDAIDDIPDNILNWAIECESTKRPFKIIKQEMEFYRQMRLPVPRLHPDERHRRRMSLRNPRKLWDRECAKCRKPIATSYAPERPEIVYCEECYLKEVY
jgi:hypothetical protein